MSDDQPKQLMINISLMAILKVVGVILALLFLNQIRDILIALFVAMLLALALNPSVDWLMKKKLPRVLAVAIIYVGVVVVFFGTLALLIPPLTEQVGQITHNFPALWQQFEELIPFQEQGAAQEQVVSSLNQALATVNEVLASSTSNLYSFIGSVFGNLVTFILILVLTFYFLIQEGAIRAAFNNFTPAEYRPYLNDVIGRMQERVSQWLRGQLILVGVIGCLTLIGLIILDVKYFLVLALLAGILEIVPYLGPLLAGIPAIFFAFTESPWKGVAVLVMYWLIQQLENHVIAPKVMQSVIGLNPIVIILVILIGAQLAGFIGVVVSVPLAAALSVLVKDILEARETSPFHRRRVSEPPEA